MGKSSALRQADYRARHNVAAGVWRLNTVLSVKAKRSLERMAAHSGMSQRALLEQLLIDAEDRALSKLDDQQRDAWFTVTA